MSRLAHVHRRRVVSLSLSGTSISSIVSQLNVEGVRVSRNTVSATIKRYKETSSIEDRPRSGRPSSLTSEHKDFIDEQLTVNRELTARKLARSLKETFQKDFSLSQVKRARLSRSWVATRTRYGQMIRTTNKAGRLAFAINCIETGDVLKNGIFTDESTEQSKKRGKPKHPAKVNVWGGVSRRGATKLLIFDGIMRKEFFIEEILKNTLLPFARAKYPDGDYRLIMDNDPKHSSRAAQEFMVNEGINWFRTPAESPDMNPIEHIWHQMKYFIRNEWKAHTKEELIVGLEVAWRKYTTPENLKPQLRSFQSVLPHIIANKGDVTRY